MRCVAARANTALTPSPASLVVARSLRSTWRSRPHSPLDLHLPRRHPLFDVSSPLDVGVPTQVCACSARATMIDTICFVVVASTLASAGAFCSHTVLRRSE
eukprot:1871083-Pleurochrysis_carterae.AAC.1